MILKILESVFEENPWIWFCWSSFRHWRGRSRPGIYPGL